MALRIANKRLTKELAGKWLVIELFDKNRKKERSWLIFSPSDIHKSGSPTGTTLLDAENLKEWKFTLSVLGESVYEGETFALRFRFNDNYPLEAPEVVFLTSPPYKAPEVGKWKKEDYNHQDVDHNLYFCSWTASPHLHQWTLLCFHLVNRMESST